MTTTLEAPEEAEDATAETPSQDLVMVEDEAPLFSELAQETGVTFKFKRLADAVAALQETLAADVTSKFNDNTETAASPRSDTA